MAPLSSSPLDPALTRRRITPALADRGIRRDTAKFLRGVDASELLEVSKRLRRFTKPVVLLWGDADRFFPIDLAHRLREAFPNDEAASRTGTPSSTSFAS